MGEKLVVGPINKGQRNDRTAFVIDNDSFPTLYNAFQWRGRLKRKRGTSFLGRLTRYFDSTNTLYSATPTFVLTAGAGNLFVGFSLNSKSPNANIVPGTVKVTDTVTTTVYIDNGLGALVTGGTINYATGAITIPGGANHAVSAKFSYYPSLPVMGLENFESVNAQFPSNLGFDTVYSYFISNLLNTSGTPYTIYDVSFYKNPVGIGSYVQKTISTPLTWNGQSYQQFWTVNYQGALWSTNGITVPFTTTNIGMQFAPALIITDVSVDAGPPSTITVTISNCPLVIGDFVFFNEWTGTSAFTLNLQTGYVTAASPNTSPFATKTLTITLPNATIIAGTYTPGIIQYLTNRSDPTKDNIRWYDGDPTNGAIPPTVLSGKGWVNFMPPLSTLPYSIGDQPKAIYYLVGARLIYPYKDRLIFFGPVIQASGTGANPIYLQDTIVYSENGTVYYTASFPVTTADDVLKGNTTFFPLLCPANQTASPLSMVEDSFGFGGSIIVGIEQPITTVSPNQDVLLVGFPNKQTKMVYSGNDVVPFNFYIINSELGSSDTFSTTNLDRGVISVGPHGINISDQTSAQRIDLAIPDQIFQFNLNQNGPQRTCSARDFIQEWIYITYNSNLSEYVFPTQTLQYNYRDDSWALFGETYTTYGQFRIQNGFTWSTVGLTFPTWRQWNVPWDAGASTAEQPSVIAGNQQGFVVFRDEGTTESPTLAVNAISGYTITSPNHCLSVGDFIVIIFSIGNPPDNNLPLQVTSIVSADAFTVSLEFSGSYSGGATITRCYIPDIRSKQFPVAWDSARKTRIGAQQYLLSKTTNGQITLNIYLSQDSSNPYNAALVPPDPNAPNNSLMYTNILYTCPESTNLGLTPANSNLNTPTASTQAQLWHRINTSLIGDTVQVGFTLSNDQMLDPTLTNQFSEIEIHSFILDVTPSQLLV